LSYGHHHVVMKSGLTLRLIGVGDSASSRASHAPCNALPDCPDRPVNAARMVAFAICGCQVSRNGDRKALSTPRWVVNVDFHTIDITPQGGQQDGTPSIQLALTRLSASSATRWAR